MRRQPSTPKRNGPIPRPLVERFWPKVQRTEGCWLWLGAKRRRGYGEIGGDPSTRTIMAAHRVSWELHFGPIPEGMDVCHRCDNPPCVNPAHLFLGTESANMQDASAKGRLRNPAVFRPEKLERGAGRYNAKMTEDTVRTIRRRRAEGALLREIAAELGITFSAVDNVLRGVRWKHVI